VDPFALAGAVAQGAVALAAEEPGATAEAGLQINLFWIIVSSLNFVVFAVILYWLFGGPITRILSERRARIQQGLDDAEEARRARAAADEERIQALQEARREANEILTRAQKLADESRERDLAAAREEVERVRARATADLEAEKQRAIADIRAEVADLALAAAGRVVGETMNDDRQRRLVDEFLRETSDTGTGRSANG
jgi:F-type H+-transporting ATPase subunit b